MTVFGAVFARGGSEGVPGKNLRKVAGRSLLDLAISIGVEATVIDQMICSTDSDAIAGEAERLGAHVPFLRPAELARSESPEWGAWQHLANHLIDLGALPSDILVSLPTTAPLRLPADVDSAVSTFRSRDFDVVLSITESRRSPWFNMVKLHPDGGVELALRGSGDDVQRRQDSPQLFDITTVVYVTTLGFITRSRRMFEGNVGSITIPPHRAIDIDTELDLELADFLARKGLGAGRE